MTGLLGALQFLTRVPIRLPQPVPHERALPWFAVAGALIGAAVGAIAVGLGEVLPPAVAAALAVVAGLLITGAFHEDGLADVADAFGGGWTVDERLRILKDSRHGTYGVAASRARSWFEWSRPRRSRPRRHCSRPSCRRTPSHGRPP